MPCDPTRLYLPFPTTPLAKGGTDPKLESLPPLLCHRSDQKLPESSRSKPRFPTTSPPPFAMIFTAFWVLLLTSPPSIFDHPQPPRHPICHRSAIRGFMAFGAQSGVVNVYGSSLSAPLNSARQEVSNPRFQVVVT